ncbi:MAG: replicative DNA helicase [Lachnospiraceae bacterium]|nr:replicative DNA helicase [Lachnospiraceae bacterium]
MDETVIKRVMPHSDDAERAVIGSMFMDPDAVIKASGIIKGSDFYMQRYGILFDAIVELNNEGRPVDIITLSEKLKAKELPEEMADPEFISGLVENVPTSANAEYYARTVYEKSMMRKLIRMHEELANDCYQDKEPLDKILEDTEKNMFDLLQKRTGNDFVPIQDIVVEAIKRIELASKNRSNVTGIATGFKDLDYKTAGFQNSDLILLAARPSMGKTAFALNILDNVSIKNKIPAVIFSLEMSKEQLVSRLLSMESRIDSQSLKTGNLRTADWEMLVEGAEIVSNGALIIDDTPAISIAELRSKCRKYKLENDIKLVFIDYLQLMETNSRAESMQLKIQELSRSLKALARELNVPVVALSQLSREPEKRPDHRPVLSDLRDSGSIEQDADIVLFLYRDEVYNKDQSDKKGIMEVLISKHRNGPTGTVELVWLDKYMKYEDLERRS